jgi:hypothetical protein
MIEWLKRFLDKIRGVEPEPEWCITFVAKGMMSNIYQIHVVNQVAETPRKAVMLILEVKVTRDKLIKIYKVDSDGGYSVKYYCRKVEVT